MPHDLRSVLNSSFGHPAFRPGQEQVIASLLAGRSALALFPTGAGKSLCYQLPSLLLDGLTVVISPLIALMRDQVESLEARGIAAARLDSSLTPAEAAGVYDRIRTGRLKLLYIAPERLTSEQFVGRLSRAKVAMMAVDEAHCISEWGHNFRPEYLRLAHVAKELGITPVLALTATATPAVAADIRRAFGIAEADHVQTSFRRPNLAYRITPSADRDRLALLTSRLRSRVGERQGATVATFQQGTGGDAGTVDTMIRPSAPTSRSDASGTLWVDGPVDGRTAQTLISFGGLFGTGAGQVPANATIESARLALTTQPRSRTRRAAAWRSTACSPVGRPPRPGEPRFAATASRPMGSRRCVSPTP